MAGYSSSTAIYPLELLLFETDPGRAAAARAQGIAAILFDVEHRGKVERQTSFDTDVSAASLEQLLPFVSTSGIRPVCRLDSWHDGLPFDIEWAIASGAGELLFPMVRTADEVERLLSVVAGRLPTGIMIETPDILRCLPEIARMPLSRVYVGLNDLTIARGDRNLFEPMIDGTVDRIRRDVRPLRFGVAGATRIDRGYPVPFRLLLAEMARLETDFTMLRRSFRRDVGPSEIEPAITDILRLWNRLHDRTSSEIAVDRLAFEAIVAALDADSFALGPDLPLSISDSTRSPSPDQPHDVGDFRFDVGRTGAKET